MRRKLAELVPEDAAAWCSPKAFVASGLPWEKITEHARANAADLIVLGQHGHGLLDRLLVGSTTDRVLRKAPCPILVVRPQRTTEA
ncbi:MAG: universal stress protein [Planctomycetes bacterium]|nr:universal stress protein [Planctomycetota bacterium]